MSEVVHLIGSEQVRSAGYDMKEAAERMNQVATTFCFQVERLERILLEFGDRMEAIMQATGEKK